MLIVIIIVIVIFIVIVIVIVIDCYNQGEEGGERSLVLVMGGAYLLFAMLILVVDESTLETGLGIPQNNLYNIC